ncbi:type II toxin-antitoxin system VapC family toxin [Aureimonas psammosilenae]|uniref:type II toxin-antitoxin system VapC family toxin n=1 Tax=Aureimonas psammosilenae TaxID=2495496 RepID=UPI0012611D71|nr:type II toxin-antitoxin system VapC family toxin [Aureimonas psammosilenae]
MKLLLDTHILIWAAEGSRLPKTVITAMEDTDNELFFSVVSIWEFVIKTSLGREGIKGEGALLRDGLLASGYRELEVTAAHVLGVRDLPPIHGDPFDRLLLAQSRVEGLIFLTADATIARYPSNVMKV